MTTTTVSSAERQYRRVVNAWCLYDWANSAFATTVMAALLPPYFSNVAAAGLPGAQATSYWGYGVSLSMVLVAVMGPILGAIADYAGGKKRFLGGFLVVALVFTGMLFFVGEGDWVAALVFYILASIGNGGANVFYDSLLPHVAKPEDIDRVSSRGYALGYIGGGLLLLINILMIYFGPKLLPNMPEEQATQLMMRLSLASVAVWWAVFSIPIFRKVDEPAAMAEETELGQSGVTVSLKRLGKTFRDIRDYKDLFWFLLTFMVYSNGIGTIITMAAIYGAELGIGQTTLIGVILMVQFVAAPFSFLFGWGFAVQDARASARGASVVGPWLRRCGVRNGCVSRSVPRTQRTSPPRWRALRQAATRQRRPPLLMYVAPERSTISLV